MRKNLGQHFLINKSAIKKIVVALDLEKDDLVIEIGPGKGELTFPLLEKCKELNCKIIGIEKDSLLGTRLQGLENRKNLEIIIGDILKEVPKITIPYKIVGNIPYYITGKLLRALGELENRPESIVLMIQKEVADRLAAKAPKMNLLAAATQFWADPEILFTLKPKDFYPPPEVESAVIRLTPLQQISKEAKKQRSKNYYRTIKILFKQPRKTLLNNLRNSLDLSKKRIEEILDKLGIDLSARPQVLNVEKIKKISALLSNN